MTKGSSDHIQYRTDTTRMPRIDTHNGFLSSMATRKGHCASNMQNDNGTHGYAARYHGRSWIPPRPKWGSGMPTGMLRMPAGKHLHSGLPSSRKHQTDWVLAQDAGNTTDPSTFPRQAPSPRSAAHSARAPRRRSPLHPYTI